jgi:HEAT repeat protein
MRYWLSSLTIPTIVVVGAIMGCTTEAKPDEKNALAKQAAAKTPFSKQVVPEDFIPPKATEPAAKDPASDEDDGAKGIEPKDVVAKELEPKDAEPKEPAFVQAKDPKKDKDAKTPKDKDKDKKDTDKDPKEVTVPEPTEYMGKSFSDWLKQMKDTPDPTHREEAMKAVLVFGPKKSMEAVPEILTQLERHKKSATGIDLAVRVNGIMALSTIFKYAKAPPDPDHVKRAYALYKDFLNDPQIIMKVRALQGLPWIGPKAADAIDEVVKLVHYKGTWEVRKEAIQTLQFLAVPPDGKGPPNKTAMLALRLHADIKQGETSYLVRLAAIQAIANLAHDRVPQELYEKALIDPSEQVRLAGLRGIAAVAVALDNKGDLKEAARVDIVKHLDNHLAAEKDKILKIWTYAAIMTVTKKCTPARLGPVVKYLKDADPPVRMQALTIIGTCGKEGKPIAYDAVLAMIHDENLTLAGAAMGTLVNMQAHHAIPELRKIVEDSKAHQVRRDTAADAIDHLEFQKKAESEKKEKDKKTPEK